MRSWILAVLSLLVFTASPAAAEPVDYVRDIKPILARSCVSCHGVDKQQSSFRVDTAGWLLDGGDSGLAVISGKSAESLLVKALKGDPKVTQMPAEGNPLSAQEIDLLVRWIDEGAKAPDEELAKPPRNVETTHWSFKPIGSPAVPQVNQAGWVRNPIDAFILQKIEAAGLTPSPEAEKTTLIRRVSLDLLGLPPTAEQVDEFLADTSADAYERLVDRLLASPHYGERWGRHWLDAARYADSNGYTIDSGRSIWKYRDWVIEAMNANLPFDRFTIEQMAGDMLENPTLEQRIATGFHRNTLVNEEGGTDQEQFRVEAVADRVSTVGSVYLGLTLGCARCHDHKYDPISQREFYEFFALLNNADEPSLPAPSQQQARELPAIDAEIADAERRLGMVDTNIGTRRAQWEKKLEGKLQVEWNTPVPHGYRADSGDALGLLEDRSLLVVGPSSGADSFTITADVPQIDPTKITAVRLEALPHPSLPQQGPGRASNGNFVLSEVSASWESLNAPGTPTPLAFDNATADHSQPNYPVTAAVDGKPETGWAINLADGVAGSFNVARTAIFSVKPSAPIAGDTPSLGARISIKLQFAQAAYSLGHFRISFTTAEGEAVKLPDEVRRALAIGAEQRPAADQELIVKFYQTIDPERIPIAKKVAEVMERKQQMLSSVTTTLVLQERKEPRQTFVHIRGDFLRPGAKVQGAAPGVLPMIAREKPAASRLDLARWLVSPENPLTARVLVNRIWQQYFGQGIVATENDFGTQGDLPSHPELLDYLAREMISGGWDLKAFHKKIVTSATYRQSSAVRAEVQAADPYNKLLARQVRLRLEAEVVRDVGLAASGLLTREIGGPSVYPPQPQGIYKFTQQVKFWPETTGPDRYRRGMYTFFWRSSPNPFLITFDAPVANTTCTRRVRSNTPLQALTLANDVTYLEVAQSLAKRIFAERLGDDERIRHAFRLCLSRDPSEDERGILKNFLEQERSEFAADAASADSLIGSFRPEGATNTEAAAWVALARVVVNLDEFITRE